MVKSFVHAVVVNKCIIMTFKKKFTGFYFLSVVNKTSFTFKEKDPIQVQSNLYSPLEKVNLVQVNLRKDFWNCYWGQGKKMANG